MTKEITTPTKQPRKVVRKPLTAVPDMGMLAPVPTTSKAQTKASLVEELLQQEQGASLAELCQATGWLPHTCRAFLTGLRKKGRELERDKREDGTTIYKTTSIEVAA
ncbi:DUF3489 domain-containing protein [Aquisediminimonas sediminicola]|uniref:DUF3489 domain-containing protein n=1 Tax=Alteraquisediminimonas sediminicola TaxID=2676787 RepID=UPI001FE8CCB8|nr:DUF3489 domain-containing protein [Aquisediminimonas sediminicola]